MARFTPRPPPGDEIGSLLVGRRTLEDVDPNKATDSEDAFGGQWHGPALAAARTSAGTQSVNVVGAEVARGCLEEVLPDEVLALVAPALLGDGTRLFD